MKGFRDAHAELGIAARPYIGCFDWDPMVPMLDPNILMLRQDVPRMVETLFDMIDGKIKAVGVVQIPTALVREHPFL